MLPRIAVVVLNYLTFADTEQYARCLLQQESIDLNIVIVDNHSPNHSFVKLSAAFSGIERVHVMDSGRNGGYAFGNNAGIKYVIANRLAEYILISNNDIQLSNPLFLQELIARYNRLPPDKAFASPVMILGGRISPGSAVKLPTLKEEMFSSSGLMKKFRRYQPAYSINRDLDFLKVDCLPGSFFLGSADIFRRVHYFDENTFLYGEEKILGHKVKQLGLANYLIPSLEFHHQHGQTVKQVMRYVDRLRHRNRSKVYYWRKYRGLHGLKLWLLIIFLLLGVLEFRVLRFLRPRHYTKGNKA